MKSVEDIADELANNLLKFPLTPESPYGDQSEFYKRLRIAFFKDIKQALNQARNDALKEVETKLEALSDAKEALIEISDQMNDVMHNYPEDADPNSEIWSYTNTTLDIAQKALNKMEDANG